MIQENKIALELLTKGVSISGDFKRISVQDNYTILGFYKQAAIKISISCRSDNGEVLHAFYFSFYSVDLGQFKTVKGEPNQSPRI